MGLFYTTCTSEQTRLWWARTQLSEGVLESVGQEHLQSLIGLNHTQGHAQILTQRGCLVP